MGYIERNECMDCAVPGYPCLGDMCRYRHVRYYTCDECGVSEEDEDLYEFDEEEILCAKCLLSRFEKFKKEC